MKVVELVKFSGEMLKRLHNFGIKVDDYQYIPMFEDFERITSSGGKTTYAVAFICEKYGVCERKVYKVLRRFREDCPNGAVVTDENCC